MLSRCSASGGAKIDRGIWVLSARSLSIRSPLSFHLMVLAATDERASTHEFIGGCKIMNIGFYH